MRWNIQFLLVLAAVLSAVIFGGCNESNYRGDAMELYKIDENAQTRWASFENPAAEKGQGAQLNKGAKGYPYHIFKPGDSVDLLNVEGAGIIHRIWMTIDNLFHDPVEMRSMKIEMYWDGSDRPAVSAPISDFFCMPLGRMVTFENSLFASSEGRSFVCYVPMPYKSGARVVVVNESQNNHRLFYDINFSSYDELDEDALYFHASWRRENPTKLGEDFAILPKVTGKGKFLGASIGVVGDTRNLGWWGEGEVKIYLDGDGENPSLCGTGTEDYISTGWGQGFFVNRYHGSLLDDRAKALFGFYRFHVPDPVQFFSDCRVMIQQLGGTTKKEVKTMLEQGVAVKPVAVIKPTGVQFNFLDTEHKFEEEQFEDEMFTVYYRQDDVCATAYFYLDSPVNNLSQLPDVEKRTENLRQ